jgi:hypothetical protein
MLDEQQTAELRPIVRTMQIIVGVLALGVVNFMVIAVVIIASQQGAANAVRGDTPIITYAALAAAVTAIFAAFLVPNLFAGGLRKSFANAPEKNEIRSAAQIYQTLLIIRCALLEGAAFFCLVSYMLERQTITLAASLMLLVFLLTQFPTLSRVEAWVENEFARR